MPVAKIKIISREVSSINSIIRQIVEIAKAVGVKYDGPIPLPVKRVKVATRKTPCGDGSHTYEHWEMRVHKWLIQIDGSEQALRQIMRIPVPDTVKIEMSLSS